MAASHTVCAYEWAGEREYDECGDNKLEEEEYIFAQLLEGCVGLYITYDLPPEVGGGDDDILAPQLEDIHEHD